MKVCCNACKKPVKASQYAAHAGFEVFSFQFFLFPFLSFLTLQAVIKIGVNVAYGSNNRAPCNEYKHFKVVEKHKEHWCWQNICLEMIWTNACV